MDKQSLVADSLFDQENYQKKSKTQRLSPRKYKKRGLPPLQKGKSRPKPMNIKNELYGLSNQRKVLYRNFHQIGAVVYLVEISKHLTKMFFCLFPNHEKPDIYIHEIVSEKIGLKMLSDNFGDYISLISKFKIKYGKLWIEGYHGLKADPRKKSPNPNTI